MNEITLIVGALLAGLSAGITNTAETLLADLYSSLKNKIIDKTSETEKAKSTISEFEDKPNLETSQEKLISLLGSLSKDDLSELVLIAKKIIDVIEPKNSEAKKYNIEINSGQGIVIGDNAEVSQKFDNKK